MTFSKTLLVTFSMLAFAGAAYAEDRRSGFSSLDKNNDGMLSRAEYEGGGSASAGASLSANEARASELIGKNVANPQGEDLGEIKDIVVDLQGGKVHAAVLEFGGFLGLGEKQYAFPISQLKTGADRDKLVLNVDKQKLKNAEGFAKNQWPSMNDEYWGRVQGQRPASAGASKRQDQKATHLSRASELMGKEVRDKSGREVGEVQDLIVSLNDGRIRNVVLDIEDGGETRIQPKALSAGTDDKLMVNMSHDQLKGQAKNSRSTN